MNENGTPLEGFQRYLNSKKSVDDRAINRNVFEEFSLIVSTGQPQKILELGAGIGTMVQRLTDWLQPSNLDYTLMDLNGENINVAKKMLLGITESKLFDQKLNFAVEGNHKKVGWQIKLNYIKSDVYDLRNVGDELWDGFIANAFFDLIDLETVLPILYQQLKPGGWIYATINFDGETILEPVFDPELDSRIISAYHQTMDLRLVHGALSSGSKSGRKLYAAFQDQGFEVKAIGSSDWVVYPKNKVYLADEKFFLSYILNFIEESLYNNPLIGEKELKNWLEIRRKQLDDGELFFIAHQLDYLVVKPKKN